MYMEKFLIKLVVALVCFYFVLLLMCGCKTQKKIVKTDTTEQIETKTNTTENTTINTTENEESSIIIVELEDSSVIDLQQLSQGNLPQVKAKTIKLKNTTKTTDTSEEKQKVEQVATQEEKTSQIKEKEPTNKGLSIADKINIFMLLFGVFGIAYLIYQGSRK